MVDWLFTTVTLTKVMLPALLTLPWKARRSPARRMPVGQTLVITRRGSVSTVQVRVKVSLAMVPSQPWPVARTVLETTQQLSGTWIRPVKVAVAPGASVARLNTGVLATGRSLVTTMLVRAVPPVFRTIPV